MRSESASDATWLLMSVQVRPLSVVRSSSGLRLLLPTAQPCVLSGHAADSLREAGHADRALASQTEAVDTLQRLYPKGENVMLARALTNLGLTEAALKDFQEGARAPHAGRCDASQAAGGRFAERCLRGGLSREWCGGLRVVARGRSAKSLSLAATVQRRLLAVTQ